MNPTTVARTIPLTATSRVFSIPTSIARKWVERDVYSIRVWLMS